MKLPEPFLKIENLHKFSLAFAQKTNPIFGQPFLKTFPKILSKSVPKKVVIFSNIRVISMIDFKYNGVVEKKLLACLHNIEANFVTIHTYSVSS